MLLKRVKERGGRIGTGTGRETLRDREMRDKKERVKRMGLGMKHVKKGKREGRRRVRKREFWE